MTDRIEAVAVIIPAHDEAEMIGAALQALGVAARRTELPVTIVIVLDSCTDGTETVVRDHFRTNRFVEWICVASESRRASSSREHGRRAVEQRLSHRWTPDRVAVLSTDADSVVPPNWIVDLVRALDAGVDAVAGIVDLDPAPHGLSYGMWRAEYTTLFRADGSHPHVHAANLAVRLSVLDAAGGFGHLTRAEDIDLWRRIEAIPSARVRSDQGSVVRTSARLDGRVTGGFATALRQFRAPREPVASIAAAEMGAPVNSLNEQRARSHVSTHRGGTAHIAAS